MDGEFAGRHVIVTGGTGALGSAVVDTLHAAGATIHLPVLGGSTAAAGGATARERIRLVPGVDLCDEAAVAACYRALPSLWASIHLAGGFAMAPIESTTLADLRAQFDQNAVTCFLCCRAAVVAMRAGGGQGGRIVNVAARPALEPTGGMLAYAVSKAAVASMTKCLAEEVRRDGIFVNAVVPSIMDTPANRQARPDADFARWPKPSDVAAAILFLASPHNRVTSGALVPVYGRSQEEPA